MARLSQIIAIEKATKTRAQQQITEAYHGIQKADPVTGISRTYRAKDEENGDKLPPESKRVQVKAEQVLTQVAQVMTGLYDATLTKDTANCGARADIVVNGQTIATSVPVTNLLFLEKQLTDLQTLVRKLPTLDPAESWSFDPAQDCWASAPSETHRTKKIKRTLTLAAATDKHPAQVQVFDEDEVVGFWRTVKYSGAIPAQRQNEILERVEALAKAVKFAREEANTASAPGQKIGEAIFGFLLKK